MPTSFTVDPSARATLTPEQLRAAFTGQVERPRVRPLYLLGMALVAGAMVLLPLLYLALIALLAYGLYEYVAWGLDLLESNPRPPIAGGGRRRSSADDSITSTKVILYALPFIGGLAVMAFLLKPLFAPRPKRREPFTLSPDSNPLIYGYVEMLCWLMKAPMPSRIDVDEFPNASAGFRAARWRGGGGLFSLVAGWFWMLKGEVVLTVGLPLVGGMTTTQLTGVLAHEFGHFTQRLAMRLGWIISNINHWLGSLAYERDSWDERLDLLQRNESMAILIPVVLLIKGMVWLTRLILKGLVLAAHAMSCFMSRQMEYDADEWQCRVVGSAAFRETFDQIDLLSFASSVVFGNMHDRWRERRLPDDLPGYIVGTAQSFKPEVKARLLAASRGEPVPGASPDEAPEQPKRHLFDTHPTRPQRDAAALALQAPGVFRLDQPASSLFADYHSLCKQVTYNHCKLILGDDIAQATFVPTSALVHQHQSNLAAADALSEFCMDDDIASALRPRVDSVPMLRDAKATAESLVQARKRMAQFVKDAVAMLEQDSEHWKKELLAWQARYALSSGIKPTKDEIAAGLKTLDAAKAASRIAADAVDARMINPYPYRDAAEDRIRAALALYRHPDAARKLPSADADLQMAETMISAHSVLGLCRSASRLLTREIAGADRIILHLQKHPKHQPSIETLARICDEIRSHITSMRGTLLSEPYPFPHAAGQLTLAEFVIGTSPPPEYLLDVAGHGRDCLERYFDTRRRALMQIAELTLKMEKTLGLPPLKRPAESKAAAAKPN